MAKARTEANNIKLAEEPQGQRTEISIPVYSEAAGLLQSAAHGSAVSGPEEEPVFTSCVEAEEWRKAKQRGL